MVLEFIVTAVCKFLLGFTVVFGVYSTVTEFGKIGKQIIHDCSKKGKAEKAETERRRKEAEQRSRDEYRRELNTIKEAFKDFKGTIRVQRMSRPGSYRDGELKVLDFDRTFLNYLTLDLGLSIMSGGILRPSVSYVLEELNREHRLSWYGYDDGTDLLAFDPDALVCQACGGGEIDSTTLTCPYCGTVYY